MVVSRHQAICHNIEDRDEVLAHPSQEETVIPVLKEDALPVIAPVEQVVVFSRAQVDVTPWHTPPASDFRSLMPP